MKILLLGEYSGLHNNLKSGLQELGHDVTLAASGDGFKKFPADISFDSRHKGIIGGIERLFNYAFNLKNLIGYDIVQIINPIVFSMRYDFNVKMLNYIIANNGIVSLLGAGCDAFFWKKARYKMEYGPFDDTLKYDYKKTRHPYWDSESIIQWNVNLAKMVDHIIPIMYEYQLGYMGYSNLRECIPIPMDVKKIEYMGNKITERISIFHGLNRYGFKGTRIVEEAFSILKKKYPSDLELNIKGNMKIDDYLELMRSTNIVIDQMYSYSCGMNAIYAMAMGKIVFGGAEKESLISLGFENSPVINVKPNVDSIIKNVEFLLDNKKDFLSMGEASRHFVEHNHNYINVADKYVKTWLGN
ncbi:hypothetical protein PSR30_06830 [Pectobacterium carotovorum subsp. carotovorum]|uniref:glycosyltransferase n=1 Tax=Pectobacterium carotovorum TaxID=554 RepID=UPI002365A1BB|nr:hypothetical protein [Pectobacterium carotovorum]WDG00261.1 hypothetical protein PSR30_06830 [Pectobacterium carotovorum subsp. carotovorum]